MGQQQLLLLVLGIVIVGIAVVAGIQAFGEGRTKAEQDAAVSDAMRVISDVQAWMLKPAAFGGGSGAVAPNDQVSFASLGYNIPADEAYATINGCYALTGTGPTSATLVINRPAAGDTSGTCSGTEIATVNVTGSNADDIGWAYATP